VLPLTILQFLLYLFFDDACAHTLAFKDCFALVLPALVSKSYPTLGAGNLLRRPEWFGMLASFDLLSKAK